MASKNYGQIVLAHARFASGSAALGISTTHGSFTQAQVGASYTLTVSNGAAAGPTNGLVTVADSTPAGLSAYFDGQLGLELFRE